MPNLTIVSQWYPPEQAPFGRMMKELAEYCATQGWSVTVITGYPNHPAGEVYEGYRRKWLTLEWANGVRVCRVWLATSSTCSLFSRLMTFATFTVTATWRLLREPRPDVVFAVLQPLSVGLTVPLVARVKRAKVVFSLQDLHPDTQIRLGMVRNPGLIWVLRAIEMSAYKSCDGLVAICEAFRDHAVRHGARPGSVRVIENWIDTDRIGPSDDGGVFRRECGFGEDDFVVLSAGTLGYVSGAAVIVEAAELLRDSQHIKFLIVGGGPLRDELVERVRTSRLDNVVFRPFQPESRLAAVQSSGNASLVTMAHGFAETSVPSKVLAYCAAGRALIASVSEESPTAELVRRARAGIVVKLQDPVALAMAIRMLSDSPRLTAQYGSAAREFAVAHLSKPHALSRYLSFFSSLRDGL